METTQKSNRISDRIDLMSFALTLLSGEKNHNSSQDQTRVESQEA